ncbi:MAG: glycosyltransferase family 2 protein [Phycisphaerales bacterium]|nr:glycosyltransferase family 2 protein [Phycisphaerales bacterium]
MNCTVGFVVPAFNAQSTLADTLLSFIAQDDPGWSAIVVDDGSTDATAQIARSFADPRIIVLRQQNAGLATARNAGFVHTRTEFVAFIDADDTVEPSFVRAMRNGIGGADAVCCATRFVGPELEDLGWTRTPGAHDLTPAGLIAYNPLPVGSVLLRRSSLGAGPLFDSSLPVHEDWDCWLRLTTRGLRAAPPVEAALFTYRLRPGSMSRAIERMHAKGLGVIDRHAPRVESIDAPRLKRDWTLRHIARAIAEHDAGLARRWIERLSPLEPEDLSVIAATLPHAMRRADPCPQSELPNAEARWAAAVRACSPAYASELLSMTRFGIDLTRAVELVRRERRAGRTPVLFGVGERGRELAQACAHADAHIDAWIDDNPDASAIACGERLTRAQITDAHTLIVTPDAPEAILRSLDGTPARVVLLRDLTAPEHNTKAKTADDANRANSTSRASQRA